MDETNPAIQPDDTAEPTPEQLGAAYARLNRPGNIWLFSSLTEEERTRIPDDLGPDETPLGLAVFVLYDGQEVHDPTGQGRTGHVREFEAISRVTPDVLAGWLLIGFQIATADEGAQQTLQAIMDRILREGFMAGSQRVFVVEEARASWRIPAPGEVIPQPFEVHKLDRKRNLKVDLPWKPATPFVVANILDHATRRLGQMVAGGADWAFDLNQSAQIARIEGQAVGMIRLGTGGEDEAGRIIDALGARTLKTMIGTTRLLYERTNGLPKDHAAEVSVREIAEAIGYKPSQTRTIDPKILRGISEDIRALTRILTWGADGPYDGKRHRVPTGWIAPLLNIVAVSEEQIAFEGESLPYRFKAMLGENWAEAIKERFDVVQIAPGFMDLRAKQDEQAIRLGWYYLTDFRYRMTKGPKKAPTPIARICADARIKVDEVNLTRFLDRLESWHALLQAKGVIGDYQRDPNADPKANGNLPPGKIYEEGTYTVEPPEAVLEAYRTYRIKAIERGKVSKGQPQNAVV